MLNSVGKACWRCSTVAPFRMIQPCCQPPVAAQLVPLVDLHNVMSRLRLMASLRATCELATRLFAMPFSRADNVASPADKGDPVNYAKHTNIDAHYHDCQEFWLLLEGAATVVVSGQHLRMTPGDCLPIPMGAMHDMPDAPVPVKAVYFETTLRGRKRTGHLWQHTHGPAVQMEGK